jgi:uncharacterized protein YgbK (DUF1537 family)
MNPRQSFPEDLTKSAREAAYVAIGLGVLGFQKAQVRRREMAAQLACAGDGIQSRLAELVGTSDTLQQQFERIGQTLGDLPTDVARSLVDLDDTLESLITRLEAALEPVEDKMPPAARQAVRQARTQAAGLRQQVRQRLRDLAA